MFRTCASSSGSTTEMGSTRTETTKKGLLDDGFGNVWEQCEYEPCGLEIVRPGKVQCERCQFKDEQPLRNIDA